MKQSEKRVRSEKWTHYGHKMNKKGNHHEHSVLTERDVGKGTEHSYSSNYDTTRWHLRELNHPARTKVPTCSVGRAIQGGSRTVRGWFIPDSDHVFYKMILNRAPCICSGSSGDRGMRVDSAHVRYLRTYVITTTVRDVV
jgi:hypothetical protein